ncbi:MAG: hypothetical protein U1F37_00845 [Alphaproteobacteria bacterium]
MIAMVAIGAGAGVRVKESISLGSNIAIVLNGSRTTGGGARRHRQQHR